MNTFLDFIANKNSFKHHAILLLSNYFSENLLPEKEFKLILKEFCGISFYIDQHPDIFIADRERKILRLEDIKAIREFSLYPPQQALKRLFVIENCERLNANAANSLLKVLEEPPIACLFLLTSSKLSLVLPTIASRVQKVSVSFPEIKTQSIHEIFVAEDLQWIKNKIEKINIENYFHQNSMNFNAVQKHLKKSGLKEKDISDILIHSEKFAKEYEVEDLRCLLVTLINERVKQDFNFIQAAKLILANISEWKNYEGYHPSTSLWLIRLFLLFG